MSFIKIWVSPKEVKKRTMLTSFKLFPKSLKNILQSNSDTSPEAHCNSIKPVINEFGTASGQGGLESSPNTEVPLPSPETPKITSGSQKNKRKLLREAGKTIIHLGNSQLSNLTPQALLKLWKHMSWTARCAFLGTKATTTKVWLGEPGKNQQSLIADSGSDITLISQAALNQMENPPKIRTGQKVNLIQVTGASKISGYVNLPIIFETNSGPVQIDMEAYVVKGMTTPVILGNEFADQFSILIVQDESATYLLFGNSGWQTKIQNSVGSVLQGEDGHTFKIRTIPNLPSLLAKFKAHWRAKKTRRQIRNRILDSNVRASKEITIPPHTATLVPVTVFFPGNLDCIYVEKIIHLNKGLEDCYGPTDCLVNRDNPQLFVSNFLGHCHDMATYSNRAPLLAYIQFM